LGVQYLHKGRNVREGLDCYGLVKCIYADYGIDLFDIDEYELHFANHGKNYLLENYHRQWMKVVTPHTLDVCLFQNYLGMATHVGIYMTKNRVLHCERAGTVIVTLNNSAILKKVEGFYRYKGDDNDLI